MFDIKKEIKNVVENALLDSLLYYGSDYREYRDEIFKEFEKQSINLIKEIKKEFDEDDEDDEM
jgi:hypothetical protein